MNDGVWQEENDEKDKIDENKAEGSQITFFSFDDNFKQQNGKKKNEQKVNKMKKEDFKLIFERLELKQSERHEKLRSIILSEKECLKKEESLKSQSERQDESQSMKEKPRESDSNGEEGAKGVEKDKLFQSNAQATRTASQNTNSQMLQKNEYRLAPTALLPLGNYISYISLLPSIIQKSVLQLTKYQFHWIQYSLELVRQLSDPKNQSMEKVYNSIRFLLMYLTMKFVTRVVRIHQKKIIENYGKQIYGKVMKHLEQNEGQKWKKLVDTTRQVELQSFSKLLQYFQKGIRGNHDERNCTNALKMLKLFKDSPQLIELVKRLNSSKEIFQYQDANPNLKIDIEHELKTLTEIYDHICQLAYEEYLNPKFLEKSFQRLCKKHFNDRDFVSLESYRVNYSIASILQDLDNQSVDETMVSKNDKSEAAEFEKDFKIILIERIKVRNMICTLPFYSFETEVENERVKNSQSQKRKAPRNIHEIFSALDLFYVYQAQRLNSEYLKKNDIKKIDSILKKYQKFTEIVSEFIDEFRSEEGKQHMTTQEQIQRLKERLYIYNEKYEYSTSLPLFKLPEDSQFQSHGAMKTQREKTETRGVVPVHLHDYLLTGLPLPTTLSMIQSFARSFPSKEIS